MFVTKVFASNDVSGIKSSDKSIEKFRKLLKTRKLFKLINSKSKKLSKSQKLAKSRKKIIKKWEFI